MKPKRRVASYDIDFQRFRKRREALAMTQRDLSEKSGLTQSMISQIECGAKARVWLSTACLLADALGGCSIDYLVGRSNDPEVASPARRK